MGEQDVKRRKILMRELHWAMRDDQSVTERPWDKDPDYRCWWEFSPDVNQGETQPFDLGQE